MNNQLKNIEELYQQLFGAINVFVAENQTNPDAYHLEQLQMGIDSDYNRFYNCAVKSNKLFK